GSASGSANRARSRAPATARAKPRTAASAQPGRVRSCQSTMPAAAGSAVSPTMTSADTVVTAPRCSPAANDRNAQAPLTAAAYAKPGAHRQRRRPLPGREANSQDRYAGQRRDRQVAGLRRLNDEQRQVAKRDELRDEPGQVEEHPGEKGPLAQHPSQRPGAGL